MSETQQYLGYKVIIDDQEWWIDEIQAEREAGFKFEWAQEAMQRISMVITATPEASGVWLVEHRDGEIERMKIFDTLREMVAWGKTQSVVPAKLNRIEKAIARLLIRRWTYVVVMEIVEAFKPDEEAILAALSRMHRIGLISKHDNDDRYTNLYCWSHYGEEAQVTRESLRG